VRLVRRIWAILFDAMCHPYSMLLFGILAHSPRSNVDRTNSLGGRYAHILPMTFIYPLGGSGGCGYGGQHSVVITAISGRNCLALRGEI